MTLVQFLNMSILFVALVLASLLAIRGDLKDQEKSDD